MTVHARCRVGGCRWETTKPYRVDIARLAELHRRRHHDWVKPRDLDRLCEVTFDPPLPETPQLPAPATLRRARPHAPISRRLEERVKA